MDRDEFWALVQAARDKAGTDDQECLVHLRASLEKLPKGEIVAFDAVLDELMAESYRNDLWAAAYIINGGCSDDGFDYFRGWLIAQGRRVYEAALADPATLEAAIVMENEWDADLEEFLSVAREVYEEGFGAEMPDRPRPKWNLTGPEWAEDTVEEMYPALAAKAESRFGQD